MTVNILIPDWHDRIDEHGCIDGLLAAVSIGRHSTTMQDSAEDQHADNDETAIDEGLIIVARCSDEAVSRSLLERPGFQAALDLNRQGVRAVVVTRTDRALGEPYQIQPVLNTWRNLGVRFFDQDGERLYRTEEGRLQLESEAVKSSEELIKLHGRVRRGMRRKARQRYVGRPPFGLRIKPLGYAEGPDGEQVPLTQTVVDGKIVRSGEVALDDRVYNGRSAHEWLVQIFEWIADGDSPGEVAARLTANRVRTGNGKTVWGHQAVRKIVGCRQYLGERTWGMRKTDRWEGEKKIIFRPEGDRGFLRLETGLGEVVPAELWERANDVLANRPRAGGRLSGGARKNPPRLLDGLVFHAPDHRRMAAKQDRHKRTDGTRFDRWRYVCAAAPGKMQALPDGGEVPRCTKEYQVSEKALLNALQGLAERVTNMPETQLQFFMLKDPLLPDRIKRAEGRLHNIAQKLRRLQDSYLDDELFTREEMQRRKEEIDVERAGVQAELTALRAQQGDASELAENAPAREALSDLVRTLVESTDVDIELRRARLTSLIDRIYCDGHEITVWLRSAAEQDAGAT